LLAKPGIGGVNSLKNGVCCAAFWADWRLEIWNFRLGLFDDFARNWPRSNGASLIEFVGDDKDAGVAVRPDFSSVLTLSSRLNRAAWNFTAIRRNVTIDRQADVAQLVEQLIRNQQVVSSSLTVGSRLSITYIKPIEYIHSVSTRCRQIPEAAE
jgi:hypothetical protein